MGRTAQRNFSSIRKEDVISSHKSSVVWRHSDEKPDKPCSGADANEDKEKNIVLAYEPIDTRQ
jgi:hypothetical protein